MTVTLKADGATGTVAIWTGAGTAPFTNPLANLSSVLFHSDLQYPAIVAVHTGTVTFPARSANTFTTATQNLFAHGRGGFPMILGQFDTLNGGSPAAFGGSIPVQMTSGGNGRWITLGADATNVVMHELCVTQTTVAFTALTIAYTIYILDVLL